MLWAALGPGPLPDTTGLVQTTASGTGVRVESFTSPVGSDVSLVLIAPLAAAAGGQTPYICRPSYRASGAESESACRSRGHCMARIDSGENLVPVNLNLNRVLAGRARRASSALDPCPLLRPEVCGSGHYIFTL